MTPRSSSPPPIPAPSSTRPARHGAGRLRVRRGRPGRSQLRRGHEGRRVLHGLRAWRDGAGLLPRSPRLRLVQLISAGYDRVDIEAARKAGVPVANNGGSNTTAVAEHTLLLILAILKKLVWQHNNVVTGKWRVETSRRRACTSWPARRSASLASAPSARRWPGGRGPSRCR